MHVTNIINRPALAGPEGQAMTPTHWNEKLSRSPNCNRSATGKRCRDEECGTCNAAEYNRKVTGLTPLESVGTDAYFSAVYAEARRATAKAQIAVKMPKPAKAVKLASNKAFSQKCGKCGKYLEPQSNAFIAQFFPIAVCPDCEEALRFDSVPKFLGDWIPAVIV